MNSQLVPKWKTMLCIGICAVWVCCVAACDETYVPHNDGDSDTDSDSDSDSDSDIDSDVDSDTDADSDADTDTGTTDECTPTAVWGSGFTVGSPVANWTLNGIFDQDLSGVIDSPEMTPINFTLEDVFCDHYNSAVVFWSDSS